MLPFQLMSEPSGRRDVRKEAAKARPPNLLQTRPLLCIALVIVCNAVKLDFSPCQEPLA